MFKTKNKHLIVTIVMLMMLMISTVSFATELPEITGLSISSEGVMTWDAIDGASKYYITMSTWGVTHDDGSTTFNLKEEADYFKNESGTYTVSIVAEDSGNSAISKETQIEYNYESPYPKLEKPTNLVWDGLIAKWDAVTGATKYDLYVYENGSSRPVISKYDLTENQFDFTGNKNLKTGNTYTFKIQAKADDKRSSDWSDASTSVNGWFTLGNLSNVNISSEGVMTWDDYDGAAKYFVSISSFGGDYESGVNIKQEIEYYDKPTGTYNVKIYAVDSEGNTITNDYVTTYTYTYDTIYVRDLAEYVDAKNLNKEIGNIVLLDDIDISTLNSPGQEDAWEFRIDTTLDLNGHTLTMNGQAIKLRIHKDGLTFTITDSSESQTGKIIQLATNRDNIIIISYSYEKDLTEFNIIFDGATYELPNCIAEIMYNYVEDGTSNWIIKNNATFINGVLEKHIDNVSIESATFKGTEESALLYSDTTTIGDLLAENSAFYLKDTSTGVETKIASSELVKDYKRNSTTDIIVKKELLVVTTPTFDNANYGYADITAKPISITNKTSESVTIKSVAVADDKKFTVVGDTNPTIAAGATDGTSFSIKPVTGLSVGTYETEVTVTDTEDKTYTATVSFSVEPKDITLTLVISAIADQTYKGENIEPTIEVKDGTTLLALTTDYTVSYENNLNRGTATVKITKVEGSNYTWAGEKSQTFIINPKTITPTIADIADVTFNNEEQTPEITVTVDSKTLEKDTDYTVIYENNIYVGTAKVKVTAKEGSNYTWTGEITKNFKINTATSVISGSPANVTDSTNTSAVVLIGKTLDISTFVTLNPSEYQSDLTFTITDVGSTGASLDTDGKTLKGATTEGTVAIKALFTGMELNSDSNLEYSPATDLTIYVKVVDKEEVTIGGLTYADKVYDGAVVTPTGTLEVSDNKVSTNELIVKYEKFDSSWTEITELSANVGKYRVTYSVSDTNENYTGSKSYEFEITVKKLTKPTLEGTYTYTGSAQTATLTGFDGTTMEVSNNTRTDAGSQNIEVTLKDITNYSWDDDTTTALEIPFEIAKEKLTKPILEGTYTYTGEEQTAVLVNVDNETMNVTNNTRTEAGSQDITVSLKDIANYAWADGTTTDVTFPFVIAKATPTIVLENLSQKEGSVTAVTYTVTPATTDGIVKVEYKVSTEEDSTYTETLPTTKGTYTVRVTVAGDSNLEDTQNTATLTITRKTSGGGGGSAATTKYTITVKQNSNGKISPETVKVEKGDNQKFEIKADKGYEVEKVLVDGKSVGAVTEYTFEKVKEKHTIEATFKKVEEVTEETWKNPFTDVTEDDWFYEAVKYANENKLFNGVSSTEFGPNVSMTRAMLVTVLYRLEGEPATNRSIPFADVDMAMYYANAVIWAKQNNIVNGVDETNFAPNLEVTREQLVTILYRYAQYKGKDVSVGENTNILSYDDFSELSEYAIPAMQWACGSGIITGRTTSTIAPKGTATRAEVATMLMRFAK